MEIAGMAMADKQADYQSLDYNELIQRLEDSPRLLDVAIMVEDIIDSLDMYSYKNWWHGVLIDGPYIKRHWVKCVLEYSGKHMPDPYGGLRLLKYGIKVAYKKGKREVVSQKMPLQSDDYSKDGERKRTFADVWLITLMVPRRLIGEISSEDLDVYDEEVETDDIESGLDQGMTDETQYTEEGDAQQAPPESGGESSEK